MQGMTTFRRSLARTILLVSLVTLAGWQLAANAWAAQYSRRGANSGDSQGPDGVGPPPGGPGGQGGPPPGGPGAPPRPGQVLPPFIQNELKLSDSQRLQLQELQKDVDSRLEKILTPAQRQQLQQVGRRGPGGHDGGGPPENNESGRRRNLRDRSGPSRTGGPPGRPGGFAGGPGGPPGGQGESRASACTLRGVYTLSGKTAKTEEQRYASVTKDVSAIYVNQGGQLTLVDSVITTTGDSSSNENSSFYGLNAAVLVAKGSKATISGGVITTSGSGANAAFATGAGAEVVLSNTKIKATGAGGHGVMATAGGSLTLNDVDIVTTNERAGAIATDRGGGTIRATGGTVLTEGYCSPGIYSTGDISVKGANIKATGAEAAVIEGSNSITLDSTNLTGQQKCGVMIYQSFSGDAEGRRGTFSMKGGSLTADAGPLFYVTNTTAVISLQSVKLSAASGKLIDAATGRWGTQGSNGGTAILTADEQTLEGSMVCDESSSIAASLQHHSTLTGAVQGASLKLDATSTWNVTADSTVNILSDSVGLSGSQITNIVGNGHDVRYDPSLPGNQWLKSKTYNLSKGGRLLPKGQN